MITTGNVMAIGATTVIVAMTKIQGVMITLIDQLLADSKPIQIVRVSDGIHTRLEHMMSSQHVKCPNSKIINFGSQVIIVYNLCKTCSSLHGHINSLFFFPLIFSLTY